MGKQKILIVEDEIPLMKLLNGAFQAEGFVVIEAFDGIEGTDKALSEKPNLILLDLLLPKKDGIELIKDLRKDQWGKTVPIVVLSNVDEPEKVVEAMSGGVYDYLVKPDWDLQGIVKKVKEHL